MINLIHALYKMKLLSPLGISSLFSAIYNSGINIMALLKFAARVYGNKTALVDDDETLSYQQLLLQSEKLAHVLKENYQITSEKKVGFLCKNHGSLIKSIFATSYLGADIYLLNAEMSKNQFHYLLDQHDFDFLVYDSELGSFIEQSSYRKDKILSYHDHLPAINNLIHEIVNEKQRLKRSSLSKILLLTGGTTGNSKVAAHQPSTFNYLNPFLTLLTKLQLMNYNTAYIVTPIYHGYGVAMLLLFITLGKKVVIHKGFDVKKACDLIREHKVEVITVVPLMIHKMLQHQVDDLRSLSCIISGSAELNPKLVQEVSAQLGNVLCNLYGTSELGLMTVATPQDLIYSAGTVGKKIDGVQIKILDKNKNEVQTGSIGQLFIKNRRSMKNSRQYWIGTGDLGYQDHNGFYFLSGRLDDMIVSAGENIYPNEIEQILTTHPQVKEAAVIGIDDEIFGQRLKAFVLPVENANLTREELLEWLRPKIARFQLPKELTFVEHMPYTPLGKLDKKQFKMR